MATKVKDPYARALDSMTRLLAMRDHSRFELKQKLSRRFEDDVVTRVLEEAETHGWIASDQDVSERMAAALGRKHKSQRYIAGQLRKRQLPVPKSDGEAEVAKARVLIERKFGTPSELSFEERAKAFRFLRYRGFEDRWIRQVFHDEE